MCQQWVWAFAFLSIVVNDSGRTVRPEIGLRAGGHPPFVAQLPALWREVCTFYSTALARSTVVQYDFHVKNFAAFCLATDSNFEKPLEYEVMMYVALLARSYPASTVSQYLKGLKDHYKKAGDLDFASPVSWPRLYRVLKGVARAKKTGVTKKAPVTPAMLRSFRESCDVASNRGAAIWACVLVTFFGYFRKSNTTSGGASPFSGGKCIRTCDVEDIPLKHALRVTIRESKNRQFGKGIVIWIAGHLGHVLDPVAAWRTHRKVNGLDPFCDAFSFRHGKKVMAMHHSELVKAAKSMATTAGLDPATMAGHSFRRGGASFAFQCGVPAVLIQRQGDWASLCYREYISLSAEHSLAATKQMFAALQPGANWGASLRPSEDPVGHVGAPAGAMVERV